MNFLHAPVPYPVNQVFGINANDYAPLLGHPGLDFRCPVGTEILFSVEGLPDDGGRAMNASAVCVFAGHLDRWNGNSVMIHVPDTRIWEGGYILLFAHLLSPKAVSGIPVANGVVIGLSGGAKGMAGAGNSTGPHLHYGLYPCHSLPDYGPVPTDTYGRVIKKGHHPPFDWRSIVMDRNNGFNGTIDPLPYFVTMPQISDDAYGDWGIPDDQPVQRVKATPVHPDPNGTPEQRAAYGMLQDDLPDDADVSEPIPEPEPEGVAKMPWYHGLLEPRPGAHWADNLWRTALAIAWKRLVLPALLLWLSSQHPFVQDIACSQFDLCPDTGPNEPVSEVLVEPPAPDESTPVDEPVIDSPPVRVELAELPEMSRAYFEANTRLNVRMGPGTDYGTVSEPLEEGDDIMFTGHTSGDWAEISSPRVGWVHTGYVREIAPAG